MDGDTGVLVTVETCEVVCCEDVDCVDSDTGVFVAIVTCDVGT